jgi:lysozyme family protein
MGDFQRCIDHVLAEEGGLSDHPADPGGLTQYGISKRGYPTLDIANLTLADAQAIYHRDYWQRIHGDQLPSGLDLLMLDCAVNQGPVTAIKLLQRTLRINDDGLIGPATLTAAFAAMPGLLDAFAAERALRYELNPNEATFGRGWYRRLLRMHRHAWAGVGL